jgi:hypothetical protein
MTATETEISAPATDQGDDLDHIFCDCDDDRGLCGADVSGLPVLGEYDDMSVVCVVCIDLRYKPCGRCGR